MLINALVKNSVAFFKNRKINSKEIRSVVKILQKNVGRNCRNYHQLRNIEPVQLVQVQIGKSKSRDFFSFNMSIFHIDILFDISEYYFLLIFMYSIRISG